MLPLSRLLLYPNLTMRLYPRVQQSSSLAKLKKLQADFQREDGIPVWLKRGFSDRVLYYSTIVGCYLGVFMTLAAIYDNAKPESWKVKE